MISVNFKSLHQIEKLPGFAQRRLDKKVTKNQCSKDTVSSFSRTLNIKELLIWESYESVLHKNTVQTLSEIY